MLLQVMEQGEEYSEELEGTDEELEYEDEGEENTDSDADMLFGFPKKVFLIGVAIVIIVLVLLVLLITHKSWGGSSGDEIVEPEAVMSNVYDAEGTQIGTTPGTTDGSYITDMNGLPLGYIDSVAGTVPVYDESGTEIGKYTPDAADVPIDSGGVDDDGALTIQDGPGDGSTSPIGEESVDGTFSSDNDLLRKWGYTADEIELAQSMGISVDTLVERAKEAQYEAQLEVMKEASKETSEQFQTMLNYSIFCLPEVEFDSFDSSVEQSRNYSGSYVVNADYEKVPTFGNQLYIKCKIANATYTYFCVKPDRWETLPEEGNIVLRINYTMYGTNRVNMYITSIEEVDTTKITVNPEDSASDLEDILQESLGAIGTDIPLDDDETVEDSGESSGVNGWY